MREDTQCVTTGLSVTFDERRGYVGHVPDLADVSADVFAAAKPVESAFPH
jgi:hypothetical protein